MRRARSRYRSVVLKKVVVTMAAQIVAMYGSPQGTLPAPAAGQVLVIDQIAAQMKPGGM